MCSGQIYTYYPACSNYLDMLLCVFLVCIPDLQVIVDKSNSACMSQGEVENTSNLPSSHKIKVYFIKKVL